MYTTFREFVLFPSSSDGLSYYYYHHHHSMEHSSFWEAIQFSASQIPRIIIIIIIIINSVDPESFLMS
jgi:hypothetical protein